MSYSVLIRPFCSCLVQEVGVRILRGSGTHLICKRARSPLRGSHTVNKHSAKRGANLYEKLKTFTDSLARHKDLNGTNALKCCAFSSVSSGRSPLRVVFVPQKAHWTFACSRPIPFVFTVNGLSNYQILHKPSLFVSTHLRVRDIHCRL